MLKVALIDYGLGNLRSISNSLKKFNAKPIITRDINELSKCDGVILPGVGAFKDAIKNIEAVKEKILDMIGNGTPLLGICLGLQLLFTESTEGGLFEGLDVFKGTIIRLPPKVKVPHMGWNTVNIIDPDNEIVQGIPDRSYFYFVHSYYAKAISNAQIIGETNYGVKIPSIVGEKTIFATQFHPEKSDVNGLKIIENFLRIIKGAK
ncbi:MAG: imidazole glycerol phosphate synthase subunit HisH [Candidatus Odinarchaeia archaeon]